MPIKTIDAVLNAHTGQWLANPGVVAAGIGEFQGEPCIKIFVVGKTQELTEKLPSQVEGFPVLIETAGEIRALQPGD